jgi:DNA-binding NarL/FixJ family response regulator
MTTTSHVTGPEGGHLPSTRRPARTVPARLAGSSYRSGQRAGMEVITLVAGDAELRDLVHRSQPGGGPAGDPMLTCGSEGVPRAAEASQPRRPEDAGVLVMSRRGHARYAVERLTGREREVLALMAEGRSNRAIASQLHVTEHTIEKHIKNIFAALWLTASPDDHRRVLAVLTYLTAAANGPTTVT